MWFLGPIFVRAVLVYSSGAVPRKGTGDIRSRKGVVDLPWVLLIWLSSTRQLGESKRTLKVYTASC